MIDMTIDEAIAHAREVASEQKRRSGICVQNNSECDKFSACLKCSEEHEQLAEWLEELKSYRASVFSGDMTQKMLKEEYNKAIDDFAEKLNAKCDGIIKVKWDSTVAPISWAEAYADFKDDIDEIAEQLKAGEVNE